MCGGLTLCFLESLFSCGFSSDLAAVVTADGRLSVVHLQSCSQRWIGHVICSFTRRPHCYITSLTATASFLAFNAVPLTFSVHLTLLLGLQHVLSGRSGAGAAQSRATSLFPHPVQHVEAQHEEEACGNRTKVQSVICFLCLGHWTVETCWR